MLFRHLHPSTALELVSYANIDQFRESERYASAESVPLRTDEFTVQRASVALPSGSLSLVQTFPRIIRGYDLAGRLICVVPMDDVTSTRVNGKDIGRSLVILKGNANCTVYEPEGRLVAILSVQQHSLDGGWLALDDGYCLLTLPDDALASLQMHIRCVLETAALHPLAVGTGGTPETVERALFASFQAAMCLGRFDRYESRYKAIVDHIEHVVSERQSRDIYIDALAQEIGVSMRTMHSAVRAVCGTSPLRYSQLRRLWAVRRQLRNGTPGLTVKASACAHGFWHMGEFSRLYRDMIGELPSQTLANAKRVQT